MDVENSQSTLDAMFPEPSARSCDTPPDAAVIRTTSAASATAFRRLRLFGFLLRDQLAVPVIHRRLSGLWIRRDVELTAGGSDLIKDLTTAVAHGEHAMGKRGVSPEVNAASQRVVVKMFDEQRDDVIAQVTKLLRRIGAIVFFSRTVVDSQCTGPKIRRPSFG